MFNEEFIPGETYRLASGRTYEFIGKCRGVEQFVVYMTNTRPTLQYFHEHELRIYTVEHVKPMKRITGYVNVYKDWSSGHLHETRAEADSGVSIDQQRVACVKIDVPYQEGQFDE